MGVPEQAENFAPRVAPLSGPLVIAEPLGERRRARSSASSSRAAASSSSAAASSSSSAHRDRSSRKNKYVLKRRDEHPAASTSSSPPLPNAFFILGDSSSAPAPSSSDYVLQKREPAADDSPQPQTPPIPTASEDDNADEGQAAPDAAVVKKEKKVKKRSHEDVGGQDEDDKKKKKKKKKSKDNEKSRDGSGQDLPSAHKKAMSLAAAPQGLPVASPRLGSPAAGVDLGQVDQLDLPSVVADLKSLALDPFYGIERNVPSIIRHVLVGFRSLVYSKSLVVPSASESDSQGPEVQAAKPTAAASSAAPTLTIKEAKEQQQKQRDEGSSSAKPVKLLKRSDDPTKAGRKRPPSDRQEEMTAKKLKKVKQLKSLAGEKKAALNPKTSTSDGPKVNNAVTTTMNANAAEVPCPLAAEPAKKPEKLEPLLPAPPKRESPTFLIMKFPPRSTLPSVSNLKARFARFGPLVVDSTRVFWKSHSCRVQFKYKSDALKALGYVKSNDIFGQVQVDYILKESDVPVAEPAAEPLKRADGGSQFRPGNGGLSRPPQGRLKSILKKPGDEAGKESQRVKFMLSGDDSPPSASGNGVTFAEPPPPPPPAGVKSTSFQLPPAAQPRQTLLQTQPPPLAPSPARSYEPQRPQMLPPPPPVPRPVENRAPPPVQFSERPRPQPQQEQRYGSAVEMEGKSRSNGNRGNADISHQMLSLLLRCNDIVAGLRALPEFVPYRPL